MGMDVVIIKGTGLAHCKICGQLIRKDQMSIKVIGRQSGCQIHSDIRDCDHKKRTEPTLLDSAE